MPARTPFSAMDSRQCSRVLRQSERRGGGQVDQEAHGPCDGPGSTFICSAKSTYPVRWGPLFQSGSKPENKKGQT